MCVSNSMIYYSRRLRSFPAVLPEQAKSLSGRPLVLSESVRPSSGTSSSFLSSKWISTVSSRMLIRFEMVAVTSKSIAYFSRHPGLSRTVFRTSRGHLEPYRNESGQADKHRQPETGGIRVSAGPDTTTTRIRRADTHPDKEPGAH
jgi:hypothetical protein